MTPALQGQTAPGILYLGKDLLAPNKAYASANRERFAALGLTVVNFLSSPGSGKTALLERVLEHLAPRWPTAVITGDLQTDRDARRLSGKEAVVVPIATGTLCHLEASMIARACQEIALDTLRLLLIENVGNLVCPAAYDLGETARVVLMATTEGEDKPLKYPPVFKSADVVVISKADLAEAAGFRREEALENLRQMAPQARVLELSARTGWGMEAFLDWLEGLVVSRCGGAARR